jgi:hypothetical protein
MVWDLHITSSRFAGAMLVTIIAKSQRVSLQKKF